MKILISITIIIIFLLCFLLHKDSSYDDKKIQVQNNFLKISNNNKITKDTGHIFGLKSINKSKKINLKRFNNIIELDKVNNLLTVEGSIKIEKIVDFLLKENYSLLIIPDMRHLTLSGLICGIGGGSASFRYGFIHEIIEEIDILIGTGEIITCSKILNNSLFNAVPNSLGTLGYILKIKIKIHPIKKYVHVKNYTYDNPTDYFMSMYKFINDDTIDFIDGTIFSSNQLVLMVGKNVDNVIYIDNFVNKKIYWKDITKKTNHYFTIYDYIWRWDTDLYYSSVDTPKWTHSESIRKMIPRKLMKSTTITKVARAAKFLNMEVQMSSLLDDIFIPMENTKRFFDWYKKNIKLYPIYICPCNSKQDCTLWPKGLVCDFGIAYGVDVKPSTNGKELVSAMENKMIKLDGYKLLYTPINISEDLFWKIYLQNKDKKVYDKLKDKYDPNSRFYDLYYKVTK